MSVDERRQLQVRVGVGVNGRVLTVGPTGAVAVNLPRAAAVARVADRTQAAVAQGPAAAATAGRDVVPSGTWHARA